MGSGVLALPFALARLGWVPGLVLVLALALLNLYSGVLLWRLHLLYPIGVTYGDLAGAVGGPPARAAVFAVAYCYFFALQIVYLLTAAECLQVALFWLERCLYWYTLAAFAVLLALSQCRSLHAISYLGVLSSAAVLLSVVVLLVDSLSTWSARGAVDIEAFATGVSFQDAFAAAVSILFLYAGQGLYPGEHTRAHAATRRTDASNTSRNHGRDAGARNVRQEPLRLVRRHGRVRECRKRRGGGRAQRLTRAAEQKYLSAGVPMYFRYGAGVAGNLLYSMPKGWMRTGGYLIFPRSTGD